MIYVLDSNTISSFKFYYADIFPSFWSRMEALIAAGRVTSVDQVQQELASTFDLDSEVGAWVAKHKDLFLPPSSEEMEVVAEIFRIRHFQQLLTSKARLRHQPVADPFLVARAKVIGGCVVTEEVYKENGAKIPNVCERFEVDCTNLAGFLAREGLRL